VSLSELTDPTAVLSALREYDQLGADAFLAKYGFGPARGYFLLREGRRYDSKAIVGAAYGFQFPDRDPLGSDDFSGGDATVKPLLQRLGFRVEGPTSADVNGRYFGDLPSFPVGSHFPDRRALSASRVHRPPQAGISGSGTEGADSIVVSGGYEDDEDNGDIIVYTGQVCSSTEKLTTSIIEKLTTLITPSEISPSCSGSP
jgi:hypothetical protein